LSRKKFHFVFFFLVFRGKLGKIKKKTNKGGASMQKFQRKLNNLASKALAEKPTKGSHYLNARVFTGFLEVIYGDRN